MVKFLAGEQFTRINITIVLRSGDHSEHEWIILLIKDRIRNQRMHLFVFDYQAHADYFAFLTQRTANAAAETEESFAKDKTMLQD